MPTAVLVRRGVGAKGHTPLESDEIEFPRPPSPRILKEFLKRRVAAFLEVLVRFAACDQVAARVSRRSDGFFCNL